MVLLTEQIALKSNYIVITEDNIKALTFYTSHRGTQKKNLGLIFYLFLLPEQFLKYGSSLDEYSQIWYIQVLLVFAY